MKRLLFLLFSVAMGTSLISSCGSENDESEGGSESYISVPETSTDTWVSDNDIKDEDLLLLTDLSVKIEYMRLELVKMLSNNFEGNKLFCGDGPKSNYDPTVETFTRLMADQDKYIAAIDRPCIVGIAEIDIRHPSDDAAAEPARASTGLGIADASSVIAI